VIGDSIVGTVGDPPQRGSVALADVQRVDARRVSAAKTGALGVGALAVFASLLVVAAAILLVPMS
jgi:hypothetical protein